MTETLEEFLEFTRTVPIDELIEWSRTVPIEVPDVDLAVLRQQLSDPQWRAESMELPEYWSSDPIEDGYSMEDAMSLLLRFQTNEADIFRRLNLTAAACIHGDRPEGSKGYDRLIDDSIAYGLIDRVTAALKARYPEISNWVEPG